MVKRLLKNLFTAIAILMASPVALAYVLSGALFGTQASFSGWSQLVSLVPGISGIYFRRAFYQMVFERCGTGASICFGTVFSHPECSIGRNVYVGVFCCLGQVTLEDDVLIGSHVSIMNGSRQHGIDRLDIPVREQPGEWPRINIGTDTWIGDRAVVMANIGRHCVVGAGSVVTADVPDFAIVVGVPARVVRFRNETAPSAVNK